MLKYDIMAEENTNEYFTLATKLARTAGEHIREAFYVKKTIEMKSCATDLVTETDKKVEKIIFDEIKAVYPNHKFIGEESASDAKVKTELTADPTWIVDPVDGTTNFVHKFPYVAVCIGLVINKQTVMGVVYNPILDQMFSAKRGQGAFLNNKKITTSDITAINKSMILTEFGSSRDSKILTTVFHNMHSVLTTPVHGIRSLGSCALSMCMVAQGGAEACFESGIHCWDFCASGIVVEEAGGVVIDTAGGKLDLMRRRFIAANNMTIAQSISKKLEQMEFPRDSI